MTTPQLRFLTLLVCLLALLALSPAVMAAEQPAAALQGDEDDEDDDEDDEDDEGSGGDRAGDDEDEDLDLDRDGRRNRRVRPAQDDERPRKKRKRPVREVVKGAYAKINIGPIFWFGDVKGDNVTRTGTSGSGTEMDFSFGYDIVDTLHFSLAVEGSFFQTITNGRGVSEELGPPQGRLGLRSTIQGDFRVFGAIVAVRAGPNLGGKRVKRLNISGHAGGGIGYSPPLVDMANREIDDRIRSEFGGILQGRPLGLVQAGVGIEYYTKLAHFSLGVDIDFNVIIGGGAPLIAMGLATAIFVKYTF
jgi:hypothetical protein